MRGPIRLKRAILLLIAALLIGSVTGCAKTEADDGGESPATKDELVLAIGGEPGDGGYDPTAGWGRYGSPLFQSTLLTRNNDLEIVNDLATGYEVSDDGLTYTVKLRPAKFSDGEDLTADDVVFTYRTAGASGSVVDLTMMKEVEAPDASTVRFTLNEPSSVFVYRMAELGIVPEHAYGTDYADNPL
ncbi:MAG: ABC transporter substrate-binding protein, partial [Coriobacteriia bacterium]|nr:ABC transporter substrate-binding protein [Coriobacteriia bacterium]